MSDKILSFDDEFSELSKNIHALQSRVEYAGGNIQETDDLLSELKKEMQTIPGMIYVVEGEKAKKGMAMVDSLDSTINDLSHIQLAGDIKISSSDVIVSVIAGLVATIIDIIFVGTPEVVKIYKGGENFDGSRLTAVLRSVGNGDDKLSQMFHWLSTKCTVPYDISLKQNVVIPNNHRLRSFGHDPFIGLLFAVADILLGTATLVDDTGHIQIIKSDKDYPPIQKYIAVVYYLGHLLSDVCTSRGLPIPGFITTQFFAGRNNSIAKIAEAMYKDGYDLRHLVSMTTPVFVKNVITDAYFNMYVKDQGRTIETIAEKQIRENRDGIYKYKLRLMSDGVCCGGNVLKFFIPPTSGNITALNIAEWSSLIKDAIINLKYQFRDKSAEQVLASREIINDNWVKLLHNK